MRSYFITTRYHKGIKKAHRKSGKIDICIRTQTISEAGGEKKLITNILISEKIIKPLCKLRTFNYPGFYELTAGLQSELQRPPAIAKKCARPAAFLLRMRPNLLHLAEVIDAGTLETDKSRYEKKFNYLSHRQCWLALFYSLRASYKGLNLFYTRNGFHFHYEFFTPIESHEKLTGRVNVNIIKGNEKYRFEYSREVSTEYFSRST